jgi:protein-S-isoprenylcysteine O-methyltransferase Ste14
MTTEPAKAEAVVSLVLFAAYLLIGFVVRTVLQYRRTGDSGFRGISGRPGSPEWWAGVLFVAALVAGVLGPVTVLLGLDPVSALMSPVVQVCAAVVTVLGIVATFVVQVEMGTSWRIGVEVTERTDLVVSGPFATVRNPIFSAMAVTGAGLAFLAPNLVALAGFVLLVVALQLQVRVVEEPYLRRVHGADYAAYEVAVGRFLPGVGRGPASQAGAGSDATEVPA